MAKKILLGGFLVLGVSLSGLWWLGGGRVSTTGANLTAAAITAADLAPFRARETQSTDIVKFIPPLDSDHDGLLDWEEEMWSKAREPEEKMSLVIGNALDKKGAPLTTEAEPLTARPYTTLDLQTWETESKSDLRLYGQQLSQVVARYGQANLPNEMKVTLNALTSNQPEKLAPVEAASALYEKMIGDLLALKVPQAAAPLQLALINSLSELLLVVNRMDQVFSEPVLALQAATTYPQAYLKLLRALGATNNFFKQKGVEFTAANRVTIPLKF